MHALLLNADYAPLKVISWQRAVELVLDRKATTARAIEGRFVRSQSFAMPWPSVVALRKYTKPSGRLKFSPRNVFARDGWKCSFCGVEPRHENGRPDLADLTVDHVVPRAHSDSGAVYLPWAKKWVNTTCWENATTACRQCNARKADRTPAQAGMTLRSYPRAPTPNDIVRMSLQRVRVEPEWVDFIPSGWTVPDTYGMVAVVGA
jgi:5-methylcytosine-specific restriction endonuclease McrA